MLVGFGKPPLFAGCEEPCAMQPLAVGGAAGSGGYCCTTEVRGISTARLANGPDPLAELEQNCSRRTSGSSESPRPRAGLEITIPAGWDTLLPS